MSKKQIILLSIGIGFVVVIAGVFYLLQKKPAVPSVAQSSATLSPSMMPQDTQQAAQAMNPTVSVSPSLSPGDVVKKFYSWYISYPGNVLSTGAYKTSPYVSDDFKQLMINFASNLNPNFDPVFCKVNKTNSFSVSDPLYQTGNTKATVEITRMNTTASLYHVVLVHIDGAWKIDDVICVPPGH